MKTSKLYARVSTRGLSKDPAVAKLAPPARFLWRALVQSCLRRQIEIQILPSHFARLTGFPCHYCGEPPQRRIFSSGPAFLSGVDRLDNGKPYTIKNSVPCCVICNAMKGKYRESTFLSQVEKISAFQKGTPK